MNQFFLSSFNNSPRRIDQKLLPRKLNHFPTLLSLIQRLTGFDARPYRDSTLKRRLELRLQATGCRNIQEYINYIRNNQEEAFNFKENLLIHVTSFFRDRAVFTFLERKVFPDWLDKLASRQRRLLRVWSVGCASGEEPYSLAMILHQPTLKRGIHPVILATDVSPRVLAKAREAIFRQRELRNIPKFYRQIYFSEIKPGIWRLCPELRRLVIFRQHDLLQEEVPGFFDFIVLRNLLIFLRPEAQEQVLRKIIQSLVGGGLLLLGNSERINPNGSLELLSARHCLYQKRQASSQGEVFPPKRGKK